MKRRGISQSELAPQLGLRQPHLANILRGHDGASGSVADGLRSFVLAEAVTVKAA
jgi:transcriptional regulator with XRE-family HTH domain